MLSICPLNTGKIRILIQPLRRMYCYGNTGVVDVGQICVIFMQSPDSYLTEAISTEINLNTNLIICIEKSKVARHFNR